MPADTQALAQAAMVEESDDAKIRKTIFKQNPDWERFGETKNFYTALSKLLPDSNAKAKMNFSASEIKTIFSQNPEVIQNLFQVFKIAPRRNSDGQGVSMLAVQAFDWTLTLFFDCLREDASFFTEFENAAKFGLCKGDAEPLLTTFVSTEQVDEEYTVGKALWLWTSLIGNIPNWFNEEDVNATLKSILSSPNQKLTKHAKLEGLSNMLKGNRWRKQIWQTPGVSELIFSVLPNDPSQSVYRFVFNIWLLSFESDITLKGAASLKSMGVVMMLKRILAQSRTEKVIRLSLVVLRNLLKEKDLCRELVEAEMLDVVQQLEYEKWRDTELYDSIREVAQLIATEQSEFSNFDYYLSELEKGKLNWGFIHTYKFWTENYKLFDGNNYSAVKKLAAILAADSGADSTTLAVACHDMGEFVSLHPSGKRVIADLGVKENVMKLMQKDDRQVRREALLCCQKIMLNKWQDAAAKSA